MRIGRTAEPLAAGELYVAIESFCGPLEGGEVAVAQGERRRGDDPVVQKWPENFVPESTPAPELNRLRGERWYPVDEQT